MSTSRLSNDGETSPSPPLFLLGLSRTGSTALEQALRILGYQNFLSMDRLATDHTDDCGGWIHALDVKYNKKSSIAKQEWDRLLAGFDVVRGLPAAAFAPELITAFPTSKVVLTTRDADSWYSSCLATIRWRATDPVLRWLSKLDWQSSSQYYTLFRNVQDSLYPDFENNGKRIFVEHNEQVRSLVRADLLLDYRVQQGWGPLCTFLGVAVPDCEFPRGNQPDAFRKAARRRDRAVAMRILGQTALFGRNN